MELEEYEVPPGVEKQHLIKLENLERYVANMLSTGGFKEQFQLLKTGPQKPSACAQKPENRNKNRYSDFLPYDANRVVLQKLKNDPHSDYINASYIDSYRKEKAFISTQGPLENTVNDFWRMIWQENVSVIAMTANVIENGRKKCEKYWPEKTCKYADIHVTFVNEEIFLDFTIRNFKIHKAGGSSYRAVRQYHFTSWPDHDVPKYRLALIFFVKDIHHYRNSQQSSSPLVLHCSAGIGRTGTVMVLTSALEMIEDTGKVDVVSLVYKLRQQRSNAIEMTQFTLIYRTLSDYLFGDVPRRNTEELVLYFNELRQLDSRTKKTGLQKQFERLATLDDSKLEGKCSVALTTVNQLKNRNCNIIPPDNERPILKTTPSNNYINAVYLADYNRPKHLVVTQYPLSGTVSDFWQLVYDLKTTTIVVLNEELKNDETSPVFWPPSGSTYVDCFKLETVSIEAEYFNGVRVRKVKVRNTKVSSKSRTVKLFHLYGWHKDDFIPPQPSYIMNLLGRVQQWSNKSSPKHPILVTCYDGCRASGFFCAASHLAGQVKHLQNVDVFQAVRSIRSNRPGFIPTVEQYRWLYEVACYFIANRKFLK